MRLYLLYISIIIACSSAYAVPFKGKTGTLPVFINTPDSSVHAHILNSSERCKAREGHRYYWYSRNSILSTDGNFSGKLLHGTYTSYYIDNNLCMKGEFKRGLKEGLWITWYRGGFVHERINYSNGKPDGKHEIYDSTGRLSMRIYYRNGVRAGKTKILSQDGTDSVIRYKKGHPVVKSPKDSRRNIFKLNRNPDSTNRSRRAGHKDSVRTKPTRKWKIKSDSLPAEKTDSSSRKTRMKILRRKKAETNVVET